jgi:glutaredoxin
LIYRVFSTKTCPKCEQLKGALSEKLIKFENLDLSTPEALTELRVNGVFTLSAPVLQVDDAFYTMEDLFEGDRLKDLNSLGIFS